MRPQNIYKHLSEFNAQPGGQWRIKFYADMCAGCYRHLDQRLHIRLRRTTNAAAAWAIRPQQYPPDLSHARGLTTRLPFVAGPRQQQAEMSITIDHHICQAIKALIFTHIPVPLLFPKSWENGFRVT